MEDDEIVAKLRKLQSLPPNVHWFCPSKSETEDDLLSDDGADEKNGSGRGGNKAYVAEERRLVEEAKERSESAISCLQLLAFETEDMVSSNNWYKERLDQQLLKCDACVRHFHRDKKKLMEKLKEEHEEHEVIEFEKRLGELDLNRVRKGLLEATRILNDAPPEQRGLALLEGPALFAVFEALSAEAVLENERFLRDYFDEPFTTVQIRRQLRLQDYVPAMGKFLFGQDHYRVNWARRSWVKMKQLMTAEDFAWAIHDPLLSAMRKIIESPFDSDMLLNFWCGVRLVVDKLDQSLITHSLRALDIDIYRLALDHVLLDSPASRFILQTIRLLLIKSPTDFWEAMGAISPTSIIETICNSPYFSKVMRKAGDIDLHDLSELADMLSWIEPCLASIKLPNQPAACRALAGQLMDRPQAGGFSEAARIQCFTMGLSVLAKTLRGFVEAESSQGSAGRVVVSELMEVVGKHIDKILSVSDLSKEGPDQGLLRLGMDVIRNALALDCQCFKVDYETVDAGQPLQHKTGTHSQSIWQPIANALTRNRTLLAHNTLVGMTGQFGLEMFTIQGEPARNREKLQFNEAYGQLTEVIAQIYQHLSDYDPEQLDTLFENKDTASPLIAGLFAPEQSTYEASIEVVRVVSSNFGRREAISHLLEAFFATTTSCISWAIRRISRRKTFASSPRMLRTCADVLDILCNSQDGFLRTKTLESPAEQQAIEALWQYQWQALEMIFQTTESWGAVRDRDLMKEFCRDTMQFAERLFDQYSVFASAIESGIDQQKENAKASGKPSKTGRRLLDCPRSSMMGLVKWLRLRDVYLVDTSVSLVGKILKRLGELHMPIAEGPLFFIENVVSGSEPNKKPKVKTALSEQQRTELAQALDEHLFSQEDALAARIKQEKRDDDGKMTPEEETSSTLSVRPKQSTLADWSRSGDSKANLPSGVPKPRSKNEVIDLDNWRAKAKIKKEVVDVDSDELSEVPADIKDASRSLEAYREQKRRQQAAKVPGKASLPIPPGHKLPKSMVKKDLAFGPSFREKREKEKAEKMARDREQILRQRKALSGNQTADSLDARLGGIGVLGKDHAPPKSEIMVSSDSEESESEDDLDAELFGPSKGARVSRQVQEYRDSKLRAKKLADTQRPVKKTRQLRSVKDMRARLQPDLSELHKQILGWDFFHEGDLPPQTTKTDYTLVSNTFKTPKDYQDTFAPLHILEAWQGFLKAKEENNFKVFNVKIASRLTVDSFVEISTAVPLKEGKELGLGEADIVLISKSDSPARDSSQPHCLARVFKINRKKGVMEISYRVNTVNPLIKAMSPNTVLKAVKLTSLTPLEREYGALKGLQYYDLCDEIIRAKPSPLLNYSQSQLTGLMHNYSVNTAQAKAVMSAIDNDAFTLVQGPPGSGKTKTITAIVGALLTNALENKGQEIRRPAAQNTSGLNIPAPQIAAKKLLVCAPSNAAVDELVMRFKTGAITLKGEHRDLNVVRLGKSDAINSNVMDVTLEELVNKKLSVVNGNKINHGEEIHKLVEEIKLLTEKISVTRARLDETRAKGEPVGELQKEFDTQKKSKARIGMRIDEMRDKASTAARDADINRRKVQQEILDGAHVLCATLSGSGHDMFQHLKIEFETVIIDEAAQSIELSALIPLKYGCSKCILVGDPKQLPPTVLSREAARFQYEQSLFVRMQSNHPNDVHLLDTQYRMHPEISQFPSKAFYDGRLLDGENMALLRKKPWHESSILGPYRFFDVQGQHQSAPKGHSLINVAELNAALQLYTRVTTDYKGYDFKGKVGIITPYKSQLRELKVRFSRQFGDQILDKVEFNTTDAFQGRESEIIIFSCVRASSGRSIGFLDDIRRMNVGLTRAKSSLWVLGNSQTLLRNEFWGGLVENARSRDRYTTGDVMDILRRPTVDPDVKMSNTPEMEKTKSVRPIKEDQDVEMSEASLLKSASTSGTNSKSRTPERQAQQKNEPEVHPNPPQIAAGGRWGLDTTRNCSTCGSFAHTSRGCDNLEARAAAGHVCHRCGASEHTVTQCDQDRCIACGDFGHLASACKNPVKLPRYESQRMEAQENRFATQRQRAAERRAERQLGGHDTQVPAIKTSRKTPPPDGGGKENKAQANVRANGRRRDGPQPPPEGLETFRPAKGPSHALPPRPTFASEPPKGPAADRRPNEPPRGPAADSRPNEPPRGPKGPAADMQPNEGNNANQPGSNGQRPPTLIRPPANQPPKRKRPPVDPFLRRPDRKKQRPP